MLNALSNDGIVSDFTPVTPVICVECAMKFTLSNNCAASDPTPVTPVICVACVMQYMG